MRTARWASRAIGLLMLLGLFFVLKLMQAQFEKLSGRRDPDAGTPAGTPASAPTPDESKREGDIPADAAIAVHRQAVEKLPRNVDAWEGLAELLVESGQDGEALRVLAEGCRRVGWRHWRSRLRLLNRAHALNPRNVEITCRLAPLLKRAGDRGRALHVLAALDGHVERRDLRRLRGLAARLSPTPVAGWRWLRAVVAGR